MASNITIPDNRYDGTAHNGNYEDEEVEPGMLWSQTWDLEGFFLDGYILSMVGGFDFIHGNAAYPEYTSGDIFLDTSNPHDAQYAATDGDTILENYGYDYVIHVDWTSANKDYAVYALDQNSVVNDVLEWYNDPESNPWNFVPQNESPIASGSFSFGETTAYGFVGDTHYLATGFDLGFLDSGTNFIAHFTMGCGNDNLMGQGTVPEPATLLLLGTALICMAGLGRKRFKVR
jgi:hypothetical protein